jgi:hypothetical protein
MGCNLPRFAVRGSLVASRQSLLAALLFAARYSLLAIRCRYSLPAIRCSLLAARRG